MTDVPAKDIDELFDRIESDLKLRGKSKEQIQKSLSDPEYIEDWLTKGTGKRHTKGKTNLAKLIASSHKVKDYIRGGKLVKGHRQTRRGWTDEEKAELFMLSVDMNLHEIAKTTGRSYDSVRRARQRFK